MSGRLGLLRRILVGENFVELFFLDELDLFLSGGDLLIQLLFHDTEDFHVWIGFELLQLDPNTIELFLGDLHLVLEGLGFSHQELQLLFSRRSTTLGQLDCIRLREEGTGD